MIGCSMVEGTAVLTTLFFAMQQNGIWKDERGTNSVDGASHFYNTYETADAKWIAIGPMEPQFYATLIAKIGADPAVLRASGPTGAVARIEGGTAAHFQNKDTGGVASAPRRQRRLFLTRIVAGWSAKARPQSRARQHHRSGRCNPARAGAEVQPHEAGGETRAASARRGYR